MDIKSILVLLGVNFFLINLFFRIAVNWKIVDTPNERSSHREITIRGGGILFPIAWLMFSILNGFAYPYVTVAILIVSVVSFIDDLKPQGPLVRLIFHLVSLLLVFHQFDLVLGNLLYLIPALVISIGILNAVNFMDGINGITGLYFLVFLITSLLFQDGPHKAFDSALSLNQPYIFLITALVVFGFYNFRKKAKTFAGDVGSVSVGLLIIALLLNMGFSQVPKNEGESIHSMADFNWSILFFLVIYGLDSVLTIFRRILKGQNIFKAHREHLYQILCNQLNWSHLTVALLFGASQLIVNLFILYGRPSLMQLIIMSSIMAVSYILIIKGVIRS